MTTTYLNIKTSNGVETWEEVNQSDFPTFREYKQEIRNLLENYSLMGYPVYSSSRATRDWSER